jgi:hypothetical protein
MPDISDTTIREVCFNDWDAVQELRERVGLSALTSERQRQSWETNPAMIDRPGSSNGWVMETNGKIVGYLGSIPLLFRFENNDVTAAAASAFAVDTDHRSSCLKLTAAFLIQKNVDLLLVTTANTEAEQIFRFFKAKSIAQKEYNQVLFYICNESNFLKSVLIKKSLPSAIAFVGSIALAPLLYCERMLKNRVPKGGGSNEIRLIGVESIGNDFDKLWERKTAADPQRLYAYRTSSFLRWHFERLPKKMVKILCAYHCNILVGYAVVMREEVLKISLNRYKIVDLFVENDDINTIDQLIKASYDYAKKDGASVLEMIGFPEFVRNRFAIGNPYSRILPSWPYLYKSMNSSFRNALKSEAVWYASPFDGDASL